MRQIAISVAAFAAMGILATTAQADVLAGVAAKNGSQCFSFTSADQTRDSRFGSWGACPQAAAVAPAPRARKHGGSR
jgi:hypothetical protein